MPLPLVPIAIYAVTLGTAAFSARRFVQRIEPGRRDQRAEDALDEVQEGVTVRRDPEQASATARLKRVIRFSDDGSAYEVDAAFFGRVKFKKV